MLMREESFGPIIGIMKVKDDEEAIKLMQDTVYGLTASVYSSDQSRAEKILQQINAWYRFIGIAVTVLAREFPGAEESIRVLVLHFLMSGFVHLLNPKHTTSRV